MTNGHGPLTADQRRAAFERGRSIGREQLRRIQAAEHPWRMAADLAREDDRL
jgi:hypothetical protein